MTAARDAGVDLAFFSGNEAFWKTRWATSIDPSSTGHRTLVSYKETHANAKIDPQADTWTGTWRDTRAFNPEGPKPENALTGTAFTVNSGTTAIKVPADDGKMRLWRGTSVASQSAGQTATLADSTLGYEWDEDLDNGARPAGPVRQSSTTVEGVEKAAGQRIDVRTGHGDPPSDALPRRQRRRTRRPGVRGGHGPAGVGAGRQARPRERARRRAHQAGDGEPAG